jgi:hypothetical protein
MDTAPSAPTLAGTIHLTLLHGEFQRISREYTYARLANETPLVDPYTKIETYLKRRWGVTKFSEISDADRHIAIYDLFLMEGN